MPKKFTTAYNIPQKVNCSFDDDSDYFLGTPYHHVVAIFLSGKGLREAAQRAVSTPLNGERMRVCAGKVYDRL